MIVTIDGPAGAGKSSAARALAARLGFEFLDTGAMYRAVALAAVRAGVALNDDAALQSLLDRIRLEMPAGRVLLDGEDVSSAIRTPEVSAGSSVVAASAAVRPRLAELQRQIAQGRDIVCEGRDQGTVVFPDAGCKFFLTADAEERLHRRVLELQARGDSVDVDHLRQTQAERDTRDSTRALAPLRPAEDAVLIDSTELSLAEVVARMEAEVRRRLKDQVTR
jgi:cytidylate kinase